MTVTERFIEYVKIHSSSDERSETTPSTDIQLGFGEILAKQMRDMGISGVCKDSKGYVYGYIPATAGLEDLDCIGLIAHMDTCPDVSGENVNPQIIDYRGGDILLQNGSVMKSSEYPFIEKLCGKRLIVTDGSTLLGSDDKAGIAEILSAAEYIISHREVRHGKIAIAFTPDEEIGRGADFFDIENFGAKYAYTVDGGEIGEIEYENFNAASAVFTVHGINIHPGSAKNKMRNAVLIANEIIGMLPAEQSPAHTEGYEGFYHVSGVTADESLATVEMIIRDHDFGKFEKRKQFASELADYLNKKYGDGTIELELKDSYYNMREKIEPFMYVVENAKKAMTFCGVEPKVVAIRGGTDGARLSYEGLPCPNLSTGGYNMHSIYEFIPVDSLEKMTEVIVTLVTQ